MGADEPDIHPPAVVMDAGHQPVMITLDVKHHPVSRQAVRAAMTLLDVLKRLPACRLRFPKPGSQGGLGIGMLLPEFTESFDSDDVDNVPKLLNVVNRLFPFWEFSGHRAFGGFKFGFFR